jgi:hypothetical protein
LILKRKRKRENWNEYRSSLEFELKEPGASSCQPNMKNYGRRRLFVNNSVMSRWT